MAKRKAAAKATPAKQAKNDLVDDEIIENLSDDEEIVHQGNGDESNDNVASASDDDADAGEVNGSGSKKSTATPAKKGRPGPASSKGSRAGPASSKVNYSEEQVSDDDMNGDANGKDGEEQDYSPAKNSKRASPKKKGRGRTAAAPKTKGKGKKKPAAAAKGRTTARVAATMKKAAEESESEDEDYAVESIIGIRESKSGAHEYFVKWVGYPYNKATWEPLANLDCPDKVKEFMSKLSKTV